MRTFLLLILCAAAGAAQDGAAIYKSRCAQCHDHPTGRVPPVSALHAMSPRTIMEAITTGVMKQQAAGLTSDERFALVTFLASPAPEAPEQFPASAYCSAQAQTAPAEIKAARWDRWGANIANTRFQDAAAAGLSAADVPRLKLKWAFGLGDGTAARSQPAIAGGHVYVAGLKGGVYSLDARSGCVQWRFNADTPVRSAIVTGASTASGSQPFVYFGDHKANAYAVAAATGKLMWKAHVAQHFAALITGAPQLHAGVLYVPVSSYEEALAGSPTYECCTFRGSVVALDAATGKCLWTAYTIPETPHVTGKSKTGVPTHGPSGAGVWSAPTFDEKLNRIYVATGDNYSDPPTTTSDAVLAFDAKTGKLLWSKQLTEGDVYNLGAHGNGRDFDFGQPPILVSLSNGHRALVIGQKSGIAHALDPDREGAILWQTRVGHGGPLGGIQWGSAADSHNMYVALADLGMTGVPDKSAPQGFRLELDPKSGGGLFALRLESGEKAWSAKPPSCDDRKHCSPAQSAPVSAIPDVVFSGSVDGHLRAYSAQTGEVIWDVNTAREYQTVNGQKANGGSLDATGPVIAGGMLYVASGYGQWGGLPGNVLLAFSVDGK